MIAEAIFLFVALPLFLGRLRLLDLDAGGMPHEGIRRWEYQDRLVISDTADAYRRCGDLLFRPAAAAVCGVRAVGADRAKLPRGPSAGACPERRCIQVAC
jgi:hypothetical protein